MTRPAGLPDFGNPPLDEVVIGVQFARHPEYNDLFAWEVWNTFRAEFPHFQEAPRLDPAFEVFGGAETVSMPAFQFSISQSEPSKRYWFIAEDDSHLLQFQDDRFYMNWRKRHQNKYPRYEAIAEQFAKHLEGLRGVFQGHGAPLIIKQAEVAYINIIPLIEKTAIADWLTIVRPSVLNVEQLNATFSEVVLSEDGKKPVARLRYELGLSSSREVRRAMRLSLIYRGTPADISTKSISDFLAAGRQRIVKRFCDITTEEAHKIWARSQ
jgi:uncharacterized protein (TIGR04255 family)